MEQKKVKALPENRHYIPEDFKNFAEGQEKVFAQFLLKEFHKSIPKNTDNSTAGGIYESWMIDEQSDALSKSKDGIGIKDLILEEIYPREQRTKMRYDHYQRAMAAKAQIGRNAYQKASMQQEKDEPQMMVNPNHTRKGVSHE